MFAAGSRRGTSPDGVVDGAIVGVWRARHGIHREVLELRQALKARHRHLRAQVVALEQRGAVTADGQAQQRGARGVAVHEGGQVVGDAAVPASGDSWPCRGRFAATGMQLLTSWVQMRGWPVSQSGR